MKTQKLPSKKTCSPIIFLIFAFAVAAIGYFLELRKNPKIIIKTESTLTVDDETKLMQLELSSMRGKR